MKTTFGEMDDFSEKKAAVGDRTAALSAGIILLLFLGLALSVVPPARADEVFPFEPGEKLVFEVKWGIIPAARATLEILPMTTVGNTPCYHFVATARTRPFADLFYKVRDRIDGYSDLCMMHSLFYRKRRMARRKKDITVTFDWKHLTAQYSKNGKRRPPIPLT